MWLYKKLVVIVVSSNKIWKIALINSIAIAVQNILQWELVNPIVPNARFPYPLMFSGGREKVYWEKWLVIKLIEFLF